MIKYFQINMRT